MRNKTLIARWAIIFMVTLLYGFSIYSYTPSWMHLAGISLALGFGTCLGVGLIIDTLKRRSDAQLVKAAVAGRIVRDGKPRAIPGKILPLDAPVIAPFSGKKCAVVSHIPNPNGYAVPFVESILYNHLDIARLLLEFGADINDPAPLSTGSAVSAESE